MNKYIVPICENTDVYILSINANSYIDCQDKVMNDFLDESSATDYKDFIKELREKRIFIGDIMDVEEL